MGHGHSYTLKINHLILHRIKDDQSFDPESKLDIPLLLILLTL
jgi:hypothetical protein